MEYKVRIQNFLSPKLAEDIPFIEHEIIINSDQSLLSVLLENKIKIDHSCGGNATCGTCRIFLIKGVLEPRNQEELELFNEREMSDLERLSCQSHPMSDIIIQIK